MSTKDILAAARAQAAKAGGGEAAPAAEAPAAPAPPPAAAPAATAAEKPAAKPQAPARPAAGGKPKSTAEILAAARAQAAGEAAPGAAAEAPAAPVAKPQAPAKPAAGGKPKSTADILAAARATAGKGGAPEAPAAEAAPGEKPLAKEKPKAPAKGAPAVTAEGPKLSVQEMLAAVRPSVPAGEPGAAVKPARPAGPPLMPHKPTPAAARPAAPPPDTTRRNIVLAILLSPFVLIANLLGTAYAAAWTMLAATTGIATLATARFMLPNVLIEPPSKFKIGPPADYDLGTVATKLVAQYGVWIVHTDGYKGKNLIYALISVCTHLGCTPSWLEGEQKFKCPCHGSGFYITGINFEGPAPRPLERAGIRLSEDGMLEVDKSVKFQEEMGQWNDPASYYEVVG
ncbi:MAG: ubiquinol-cytochrome c reductase iron-sulfur subunit [Deltaproteobacteria bacterium]